MTQPPCYEPKTRTDCPKRCVGCKSYCKAWAEYQAIHEQETSEINRRKRHHLDIEGFLAGQGKRTSLRNQALREKEKRLTK